MIDFVVHDEGDSVGVVIVEGVKAGDEIPGWIKDQDKEIQFTAASDIPIGHKLAIAPLKEGVIVIGIEAGWTKDVVDGIAATGKPVTGFGIEQHGDHETIMEASRVAKEYVQWASELRRNDEVRNPAHNTHYG
jgi:(2R)-sulfolactate sulfo-lyase subunit alpha